MERDLAYRRHHRKRIIEKKLHILLNIKQYVSEDSDHKNLMQPGRLSKQKVHCSCHLCKHEKHFNIPKASEKAKWDGMGREIESYYKSE